MSRCETDVAFRIIVGEDIPDFRRIAEFRKRHLVHMQPLFLEVLVLCREAGLLKVGRLSLDGTKVKANASRHKAMGYDRMSSEVTRLQEEIDQLLAQAESADESDDDQFGDLRGDEIPAELARRETRLEKIQAAKTALEEQAREKAAAHVAKMEAADAGYFSEENMESLDANDRIDEVFMATRRQKHNEPTASSPKGRPPDGMTAKQKMARRLKTKKGQKEYARRKAIIEPVYGQIKHCQGFRDWDNSFR